MRPDLLPAACRRAAALAVAALLSAACVSAIAHEKDDRLQQAVLQYRAGRLADAYGRFLELANEGDPAAARIALFMHESGPLLYGRYWEATAKEIAAWRALQDAKPIASTQRLDPASFREGARRARHIHDTE